MHAAHGAAVAARATGAHKGMARGAELVMFCCCAAAGPHCTAHVADGSATARWRVRFSCARAVGPPLLARRRRGAFCWQTPSHGSLVRVLHTLSRSACARLSVCRGCANVDVARPQEAGPMTRRHTCQRGHADLHSVRHSDCSAVRRYQRISQAYESALWQQVLTWLSDVTMCAALWQRCITN